MPAEGSVWMQMHFDVQWEFVEQYVGNMADEGMRHGGTNNPAKWTSRSQPQRIH